MKVAAAVIFVVSFCAVQEALGQTSPYECVLCESITYLDTDFTNVDIYENDNCTLGSLLAGTTPCPNGYFCTTTEGTVTWFVDGYGFVDAHLLHRDCLGGVNFTAQKDNCFDNNRSYLFMQQLYGSRFSDRTLTNFVGNMCGCNSGSYCNSAPGEAVDVPKNPQLPDGETVPGLQCVFCSHQMFHDSTFAELDDVNHGCREAEIGDGAVYYQTCAEGGVCGVTDGNLAYLGVNSSYFVRDCMYGLESHPSTVREDGFTCIDQSATQDAVASYLTDNPDERVLFEFSGELCYCAEDFCELSGTSNDPNAGNGAGRVAAFSIVYAIPLPLILVVSGLFA